MCTYLLVNECRSCNKACPVYVTVCDNHNVTNIAQLKSFSAGHREQSGSLYLTVIQYMQKPEPNPVLSPHKYIINISYIYISYI